MGITHIINLAAAEGYPNQFPFHFTYIKVVVKDSETEPIYTKFQKCNHFISQALRNSKHKVFIHCHAGKDRTGILAALISIISGASTDHVIQDYLASENDTQSSLLKIVLDYLQNEGGLTSYLAKAGMSENEILKLKSKLITNEL